MDIWLTEKMLLRKHIRIKNNRVQWHEVIVDGYLDNGKNVITKTQYNKKKPRK